LVFTWYFRLIEWLAYLEILCKEKRILIDIQRNSEQCTASNERFGASGAVARPKVCANLEVLRPSERQWEPRLRQAADTLWAMREAQCDWEAKK
jgi:hypothetical protein